MSFTGDLEHLSIVDVIQLLHATRKSGTLVVQGRKGESQLVFKDGYIYGVCSYGQLRCLKASTGERVWETLQATGGKLKRWANAFLVAQGDRYFLFNEQGDLIIARLTPKGYDEISRAHLLDPVNRDPGRPVVWSHPAFANKCVYARNDNEIVCLPLAAR